jgi:predicted O-methyltransferase YrrM
MNILKSIAEQSPQLDYFSRKMTGRLGKAFNGQHYRMQLFESLMAAFEFDSIIETGTNRGSTTEYFANTFSGPIFSIEYSQKYADFSKLRTKNCKNVDIIVNNSVDGLKYLLESKVSYGSTVFFYLDAHWYDYLPLRDELNLILTTHSHLKSIIMIDDFKVPNDDGYGFDAYDAGTLDYDYIESAMTPGSCVFFPSTLSSVETGFRRGCAVITSEQSVMEKILKITLLRQIALSLV